MLEKFSERAKRALFYARYETIKLGQDEISPEALLLGLLRNDANDELRDVFSCSSIESGVSYPGNEVPLTDATKKIIRHANLMGIEKDMIGNGDLLLALARTPDVDPNLIALLGFMTPAVQQRMILSADQSGNIVDLVEDVGIDVHILKQLIRDITEQLTTTGPSAEAA